MARPKKVKPETDVLEILNTLSNESETTNEGKSESIIPTETVTQTITSEKEGTDKPNVEPVKTITDSEIETALSGFKTPAKETRGRKPKEEPVNPMFIPGTAVMSTVDNIMVAGFTMIDGWTNKKNRIERKVIKDYLSLDKETQKEFAPMAEAFIRALNLEKDPIKLFIYCMTFTYGSNYFALRAMTGEPKPNV